MTGRRLWWTCPECGAVNDGAVCRVDGARRVDRASADQAGWQCTSCRRLNRAGDAQCRGCDGPKPSSSGRVLGHLLWIIVPFVGAGGLAGLMFLPLVISIGTVVAIVLGAVLLIGTPLARHAGGLESRSDAITLVGLGLWLVAQALPAYTGVTVDDEPNLVRGIAATLMVWLGFFLVPGVSGLLLAFA